jgi:hypothetical protein
VRASEPEQLHLAVREVAPRASEREPDDQRRAGGQRERDLPFNADVTVDLLVERQPVKGLPVDQVRDPVRAPVVGSLEPLDQRVFVASAANFGSRLRSNSGTTIAKLSSGVISL